MVSTIIKASRPATLVVALISTTLGIICALKAGFILESNVFNIIKIFLVTLAGILLQSGVNLINNFFEKEVEEEVEIKRVYKFMGFTRAKEEVLVFKAGLIFFTITAIIGIFLSLCSGVELFIIEVIGIFSAYGYSGKGINYKNYGIGALMSFIMMGPLMTYASYFIFSERFSLNPILYSFTGGMFIPAILMANEIRDYEEDKIKGMGTLTVRIGYDGGKFIYIALVILAYINTVILVAIKELPLQSLAVFITIFLAKDIKTYLKENKKKLVPLTAMVYLAFGLIFIISLIVKINKL